MDLFEFAVQTYYLPFKRQCSLEEAAKTTDKRSPLPILGAAGRDGRLSLQTLEAINRQCGKLTYVPDPDGGLRDFYTHPETTQWALEHGDRSIPNDCDDYAGYALKLAYGCGMARDKGWIWDLLIAPLNQLSEGRYNHVVAGFEYFDGQRLWTGVIDTNSAVGAIHWFQGDRQTVVAAVLARFNAIYHVTYYKPLVDTLYPF